MKKRFLTTLIGVTALTVAICVCAHPVNAQNADDQQTEDEQALQDFLNNIPPATTVNPSLIEAESPQDASDMLQGNSARSTTEGGQQQNAANQRQYTPPPQRDTSTLQGILLMFTDILNRLVPIILGIALVVFLIGILRYAFSENEETRNQAKGLIVYGVLALFVMTSVWGLVNILVGQLKPDFPESGANVPIKNININDLRP